MRERRISRTTLVVGLAAAALLGATMQGLAQPAGSAMGPGMMGGTGPGAGPGPAKAERYSSAAERPGEMGGHGPGHGMGPGMMGGYGPGYGMAPGMTGHHGGLHGLNLSDEQRAKLGNVHDDVHKKNWELSGRIMEASRKLERLQASEKRDRNAIASAYKEVSDLRFARLQARLDAQDAVEGALTQEQRQQLRRGVRWGTSPLR